MKFSALMLILLIQACALNTSGLGGPGRDTIPPDDTSDFSAEVDMPGDSEDVLVDVPDPDIPVDLPVDLVPDPPPDEITPDLPADTPCAPNSTWCAGPETLEICNADGSGTTVETCHYYCLDGPPAHCAQAVPSNVNDASLYCVAGTGALNVPGGTSIIFVDTDAGVMNCYNSDGAAIGQTSGFSYTQRTQPDGAPGLGVFSFDSFTLPSGIELIAEGGHALVILSCHDVVIDGELDAGAIGYTYGTDWFYKAGPGGSSAGDGLGAGGSGSSDYDNSGGGGGGSFGAIGGNGSSSIAGMAGGMCGSEELVPLWGGSGGGKGSDNSGYSGGSGGAGGGALEISTPASITVNGAVSSAGYGGWGGGDSAAGGGGGSGGGILLEAHTINISINAIVAANGGGGGGGSYWSGTSATSNYGEKGHADLIPAAGGSVTAGRYGCRGGNGNSSDVVNGETAGCGIGEENGGGGGGGAGRIRINSKIDYILGNSLSPSLAAPATTTTIGYPLTH